MLPIHAVALSLAALIAAPMPPEPNVQYDVEQDQVLISYQVDFGRHQISGVSRRLEWSITASMDGSAEIRLQVPVDSFESGHPQLDQELRRAMGRDAAIEIEGVAKMGRSPVRFEGTVTLHGVRQPFHTELTLSRIGSRIAVRTAFSLDLASFGVARPAEIGSKVDVDFAARLRIHPRAVISGGMVNAKR